MQRKCQKLTCMRLIWETDFDQKSTFYSQNCLFLTEIGHSWWQKCTKIDYFRPKSTIFNRIRRSCPKNGHFHRNRQFTIQIGETENATKMSNNNMHATFERLLWRFIQQFSTLFKFNFYQTEMNGKTNYFKFPKIQKI